VAIKLLAGTQGGKGVGTVCSVQQTASANIAKLLQAAGKFLKARMALRLAQASPKGIWLAPDTVLREMTRKGFSACIIGGAVIFGVEPFVAAMAKASELILIPDFAAGSGQTMPAFHAQFSKPLLMSAYLSLTHQTA
jgi:hypothetical protein